MEWKLLEKHWVIVLEAGQILMYVTPAIGTTASNSFRQKQ
jgi:hypothetical protein